MGGSKRLLAAIVGMSLPKHVGTLGVQRWNQVGSLGGEGLVDSHGATVNALSPG
jgi:hypothetical protein